MMEAGKRKRGDDGETDGKKAKGIREDNEGQTVTEEEVEEFFAILRRIRVAVKYFDKGNGEGRKLTDGRWWPSFELEDFEEEKAVDGGDKSEKGVGETELELESGLDLNSDPLPK